MLILTVYILCENKDEIKNTIERPNLERIKQILFEKNHETTNKEWEAIETQVEEEYTTLGHTKVICKHTGIRKIQKPHTEFKESI